MALSEARHADTQGAPPASSHLPVPRPSLRAMTRCFARIGLLSFGGPAGQIALMHRELVDEKRWIDEKRFLHALNYCMILPGPEAQQLATYTGWLLHRTLGGLIAGLLFILPGAGLMLALSILYVLYRSVPAVDAAFLGIKAAVLAIVLQALLRIGRRALIDRFSRSVALAAFLALFMLQIPFPLVIMAAGLAGWIAHGRRPSAVAASAGAPAPLPSAIDTMLAEGMLEHTRPCARTALRVLVVWLALWLTPLLISVLALGPDAVFTQIAGFFSLMAAVSFGGAYAVLAYVAQAAVEGLGWLAPGEMLDGLGLAETTPGPLILVLQFVGFLAAYRNPGILDPFLAGSIGAALTLWVTFAPSFLWIFLGAPYVEALRGHQRLAAALSAVTAAIVGVILNLSLWFGLHILFSETRPLNGAGIGPDIPILASFDWRAGCLALLSAVLLLRFKLGVAPLLAIGAGAGILLGRLG